MQHVGRLPLTSSDHQMRYRTDVPDTKIMGLRLELRILRLGDKGWCRSRGGGVPSPLLMTTFNYSRNLNE
ncbi:hypothetical protein CEXT_276531 [Caerostris extrusa]|uniref:Uncharacterized protein n=1 Tax=Caerostris extrusa TaxID=172846 RepID=A0AAV4ST61_CAEEX|nr:hypothetical protein CEXT_276531 [Caerostris extrusa]